MRVDAAHLSEQLDHQVSPLLELRPHRLDRFLGTAQRRHGGVLGERARVRGARILHLVHPRDDLRGAAGPAQPEPGHRVCLGAAVDEHGAIFQLRRDLQDVGRLHPAVHQLVVDVVGEDDHLGKLLQHARDPPHHVGAPDAAGRVRGAGEHEDPRARREEALEVFGPRGPPVLLAQHELDRFRAGEPHHLRIADPVRVRDHRLVALVEERHAGVVERLLCPGGGDDLCCRPAHADLPVGPVGDRLAQLEDAVGSGVLGVAFPQRLGHRLLHVRKDREVRLAHGERDDVPAFAPELDGTRRHGHGGGGLHRFETPARHLNLFLRTARTLGGTRPVTSPPSRATSRTKRLEM